MGREIYFDVPQELDLKIEEYALGFLRQGRKEWDEPHMRSVTFYVTEIARREVLDVLVMRTTGRLHDIGYFGLFENADSKSYGNVMDKKALHMINGAGLTKEFLERPEIKPFYTQEQIDRVVHLVSVHDKIEELKDEDEIAFMEADTLGAIDISRVKTTFNKEDGIRYIVNDIIIRRFPRFRTETGKKYLQELLPKFAAQFKDK